MGAEMNNAIYTLGYEGKRDESWHNRAGTNKLFVAGGPLQLHIRGSYAGIFKI